MLLISEKDYIENILPNFKESASKLLNKLNNEEVLKEEDFIDFDTHFLNVIKYNLLPTRSYPTENFYSDLCYDKLFLKVFSEDHSLAEIKEFLTNYLKGELNEL